MAGICPRGVAAYQFWAMGGEIFIFKNDTGNAVDGCLGLVKGQVL